MLTYPEYSQAPRCLSPGGRPGIPSEDAENETPAIEVSSRLLDSSEVGDDVLVLDVPFCAL